jgi:hypothetical protein
MPVFIFVLTGVVGIMIPLIWLFRLRRENEKDVGGRGWAKPIHNPTSFLHPVESGRATYLKRDQQAFLGTQVHRLQVDRALAIEMC